MTFILTAVLMAASPSIEKAAKPPCTPRCVRRVKTRQQRKLRRTRSRQCRQSRPIPCIRQAARRWNVSSTMLLRKARCESGLNPRAHNASGASGLFQFLPSTFATTPYARRWIYSAKYSALAAAWMHSAKINRGNEWVCA